MPVHLSDLNRRDFLGKLGAGVAAFSAQALFPGDVSAIGVFRTQSPVTMMLNNPESTETG